MHRDARGCLERLRECSGRAWGAVGRTLAVLAPHPAGAMPCLGEGEERVGERSPLPAPPQPSRSDRYASAGQAATRAWTGAIAGLRATAAPLGWGSLVIQRALLGGQAGREGHSFCRGKCLTAGSPPGGSGAPVLLADRPGVGLISGLCRVISSLVRLLCLMSPSPPRGAVEAVVCFSVCTTVCCLKQRRWSCRVPAESCAGRAVPASDPRLLSPASRGGQACVPSPSRQSLILWSSLRSAPTPCQG